MKEKNPILSIIVICHEQREELRRCLDSILAMQMSFEYEIIVSDDRSTDGTREMLEKEYADKVIATYCNSDEGDCATNSLRSGYNRSHAYPLAKGKYIAHVDADDYFKDGADVYVKQVEALEAHPECALAMSNCLVLSGDDLSKAQPWPFPRKMHDGEILGKKQFLSDDFFRLNQCFMMRRNPDVNPAQLYGNRYVDSVITYHHLQYGNVVFVDACDYVYVKNENSVTGELSRQSMDHKIMWCLGLYIPLLIPTLSQYFFMGSSYQRIREVLKMAREGYKLQEKNYLSLHNLHVYIYDCFAKDLTLVDRYRLSTADFMMKCYKKLNITYPFFIRLLRIVLYKE